MVNTDFYYNVFGGNKIPVEQIQRFLMKAEAYIKYITLNQSALSIDDNMKMCICEIAECYYLFDDKEIIQSEKVGERSVTYDKSTPLNRKLYTIAKLYLAHTGTMYSGV